MWFYVSINLEMCFFLVFIFYDIYFLNFSYMFLIRVFLLRKSCCRVIVFLDNIDFDFILGVWDVVFFGLNFILSYKYSFI